VLKPIKQNVQVTFHYETHFTNGLFNPDNPILRDTVEGEDKKLLFAIDSNVARLHPTLIHDIRAYCHMHQINLVRDPIIVPGGEVAKNDYAYVDVIRDAVNNYGVDRHSYIAVIGGGAVIDMVGYAAATAHRGVRLIRIPTTVLAQNDAAVGVKNSINAYGKKNFIGTFAPAVAVLNDFDFLNSLHQRDWLAGVPEAIKVALLKDAEFFNYIDDQAKAIAAREMKPMEWIIYRCAELHMEHIATNGDPFEMGSSRPLDFGHWAAHKLEQLSNYEIRHGEAVAIGIALDVTYSYKMGMISEVEWQRILKTFTKLGMKVYAPELEMHLHDRSDDRCVLKGLMEFQEHLGGQLTIMLLEGVGVGVEVHEIDADVMAESMAYLRRYEQEHTTDYANLAPAFGD
jgi:3-dehydroquinate synthase